MAASGLTDAGGTLIVKKNDSEDYAKVFRRRNSSGTKYLWIATNSTGSPLVRTSIIINTLTFASLASAEANIPTNYAEGAPVPNPNPGFETDTLPLLMRATQDVTEMNRMGLEVFPQTGPTSGTMNTVLVWGDGALFRGNAERILALGLATGFDHNRMFDTTAMPVVHRYTWNTYFDGVYAALDDAGAYNAGRGEADNMFQPIYGTRRDRFNNVIVPHYTHIDIETADWRESASAQFYKGFCERVWSTYDPTHIVIMYGKPTIRTFVPFWRLSQYYYDSDPVTSVLQYLYPTMKPKNYQVPMGSIDSWFQNKPVYINILYSYPCAPLPLTTPMYKRDSSGVIQLDALGDRDFVDYGFNEVQRGVNLHWEPNEGHENDPVNPDQGPYKWWRHEVGLAVYQGYAHYENAVYNLRTLQGSNSISNVLDGPYKFSYMLRGTNESNSWSGNYRPLDAATSLWYLLMGHTMAHIVLWWEGWTGTYGFTDDGSGINPIVNEGNPYPQAGIEGLEGQAKNVHLGAHRQSLAIMWYLKTLNRDYGLFATGDKLLTFTGVGGLIQSRGEILGIGRLRANYLFIALFEPRFEIGETMNVTIGNTKNSTTFVVNIVAKVPYFGVFVLPSGTYNANEVWIRYTSIKGVNCKVSGDLTDHDK